MICKAIKLHHSVYYYHKQNKENSYKKANEELRKRNKKKKLKYEYQINENKAIGLFKEQFIKIMLIEDKNEAVKAYDELSEKMVRYVSVIR